MMEIAHQPRMPLKGAGRLKYSEAIIELETKVLLAPSWMLTNFISISVQA